MSSKIFYNCHAHCFTIDHVPDYFAKGYFPLRIRISSLRKTGILSWLMRKFLNWNPTKNPGMVRLGNLLRYMDRSKQEKIIRILQSYYPQGTGFVLLTMDMEYMQAEAPVKKFEHQLEELAKCKKLPDMQNLIYPFIFCDPRRIEPKANTWEADVENHFIGDTFLGKVRDYIEEGIYQGIKIYPAMGYFPFDKRLKPVYDLALEYDLPITSHVIQGVVHFRGNKEYMTHPFSHKRLDGDKPKNFTVHFTHPLNFEILLNPVYLSKCWNISEEEASKYSNLKICLGHFGGEDECKKFLENPWLPAIGTTLDLEKWHPTCFDKGNQPSWFSVCCDLIKAHPNVYADISYTAAFSETYPLLKTILQSDNRIKEKTLFGTDFYVVSRAETERKIAIDVRGYLGNDLFNQIAFTNARKFISNKIIAV